MLQPRGKSIRHRMACVSVGRTSCLPRSSPTTAFYHCAGLKSRPNNNLKEQNKDRYHAIVTIPGVEICLFYFILFFKRLVEGYRVRQEVGMIKQLIPMEYTVYIAQGSAVEFLVH